MSFSDDEYDEGSVYSYFYMPESFSLNDEEPSSSIPIQREIVVPYDDLYGADPRRKRNPPRPVTEVDARFIPRVGNTDWWAYFSIVLSVSFKLSYNLLFQEVISVN